MSEHTPPAPYWLSVAVRKHMVLAGPYRYVHDYRMTAITDAIWEAFLRQAALGVSVEPEHNPHA